MANGVQRKESLDRILSCGIIPIIRGDYTKAKVTAIASALAAEGIGMLEITMNSSGALELIGAVRRELGAGMFVGAGTVRTRDALRSALDAGAQFTIAPNVDAPTIQAALEHDVLHLPGALTPTEIQIAVTLGASAVKLFPSDTFGPQYLRAVRAPLSDVTFIPTGGINARNIAEFRRAGAAAVGVGSSLVAGPDQSEADLRMKARELRLAWDNAS